MIVNLNPPESVQVDASRIDALSFLVTRAKIVERRTFLVHEMEIKEKVFKKKAPSKKDILQKIIKDIPTPSVKQV